MEESGTKRKESTGTATSSKRARKAVDYSKEHVEEQSSSSSISKSKKPLIFTSIEIFKQRETEPTRNADGELIFRDHPSFNPNLTPNEILQSGAFGGTYFRPIHSSVTKKTYGDEVWQELPVDWFQGLKKSQYVSSTYNKDINKYKVKCGAGLDEWEASGWMRDCDPYGK